MIIFFHLRKSNRNDFNPWDFPLQAFCQYLHDEFCQFWLDSNLLTKKTVFLLPKSKVARGWQMTHSFDMKIYFRKFGLSKIYFHKYHVFRIQLNQFMQIFRKKFSIQIFYLQIETACFLKTPPPKTKMFEIKRC